MRPQARWLACLGCALLASACATGPVTPPEPEPRGTSLSRYYAEPVTVEDIAAARESGLACARMILLLERELAEPWAETRDARLIAQHARAKDPTAASIGYAAWENAEAVAPGSDRKLFNEFGIFGSRRTPGTMLRRAWPESAERYAERLLASQRDDDATGRLLAGWRRLAPEVQARAARYLASSWRISIGMDSEVTLNDSLLGPFGRCGVGSVGSLSGLGPLGGLDDFQMPMEMLDLLTPGAPGPMTDLVTNLAQGRGLPASFRLAPGSVEKLDAENSRFLAAALRALGEGVCDLQYLPAGVTQISVTFSYLLDVSEARATIGLRRDGMSGWLIEAFHYEPAGASLLGQRGARLDLMPLLRAKLGT